MSACDPFDTPDAPECRWAAPSFIVPIAPLTAASGLPRNRMPSCRISTPCNQWRRFGARRRTVMTIVAAVMLGAISLYMIQQVQDLTS